jgi:hypothetical protein
MGPKPSTATTTKKKEKKKKLEKHPSAHTPGLIQTHLTHEFIREMAD